MKIINSLLFTSTLVFIARYSFISIGHQKKDNSLMFCADPNDEVEAKHPDNLDTTVYPNYGSNSFKSLYFSNLSYNFGHNEFGSCGYVAMAMLLTYFDTFHDDDLVPETYDVAGVISSLDASTCISSPGTLRESSCPSSNAVFSETTGYNPDTGEPIIRNNYSLYKSWLNTNYYYTSLHTKLIIDHVGLAPYNGVGVNEDTFSAVFSEYFTNINYSDYTYIRSPVGSTSAQVKAWVIEQIVDYDRPVILGTPGHVTVAYEYDSDNDIVYVHNGWLNSAHYAFTTSFSDAHTLVFNPFLHNDSNNYLYSGNYYCECELNSHNHYIGYEPYSSTQHECVCYCGHYYYEAHTFRIYSLKPRPVYCCTACGYLTN